MHEHRISNLAGHVAPQSNEIVILSYARTPIGSFGGSLSEVAVSDLGAAAIRHCFQRSGIQQSIGPVDVDEVVFGHVLASGCGQAPVRQAALKANIPLSVPCTSVNKVCASGMKALTLASSLVQTGHVRVCIVGGMESMSRVPYLISSHRKGKKLGHDQLIDGLIQDGLWDVYNNQHMGNCAEKTARDLDITREMQDEYASLSARRATAAHENGAFSTEIVGIDVKQGKKSRLIAVDEHISKLQPDRLPTLSPAFEKLGSVTAGNASAISDGAAALLLSSSDFAKSRNIVPVARIVSWADGEREPIDFGIAPSIAVRKALSLASLGVEDIDLWEINEAFAAVVLANAKLLGDIPLTKINILGGAISLGHPLGCSGARIICTLLTAMKLRGAKLGCAAICNGGGGSTAVIVRMC